MRERITSTSIATPDQPDSKWVPCEGLPPGCEVAVLRGNPATGPSEVFVRLSKGYSFPAHWHTANERITWVKGKATLMVQGGKEMAVQPGTYVFLPGKTAHWGRCGDEEACVLSIALDKPIDTHPAQARK